MSTATDTPMLIAVAIAAVSAVSDARTGRIPNLLTLPSAALALGVHALMGATALVSSVLGLCLAGLVPLALFYMSGGRAIGGGDVKLFAALGAWAGPAAGLRLELSAFVLLAAFALVRLAFRGELLRVLVRSALLFARPLLPRAFRAHATLTPLTEVRMGPAIFAGTLSVVAADLLEAKFAWLV
jgi:prepilin peptidase CpaA